MFAVAQAAPPASPSCLEDTLRDLHRIIAEPDPVLRNLLITQRYHELSAGMARVIDSHNLNWSTFAAWASKTAGRSIRNEEIPRFFRDCLRLDQRLDEWLAASRLRVLVWASRQNLIRDAILDTLSEVSAQVADGNRKVFEELGPVFARFIDAMTSGRDGPRRAALDSFLAALRPGPTEAGGQDLLARAFENYFAAIHATSADERAERILLANCQIGLHEQTRLQPNIASAMDAPITILFMKHLRRKLPRLTRWPFAALIAVWLRGLLGELRCEWEECATRYAMNLSLPDGREIPLGHDLPDSPCAFPPALAELRIPDLVELICRFDDNLGSLRGSGAHNWADLRERMGFIVELFRCRQQDLTLFDPPFTLAQRLELEAGRVPLGEL